MRVYVALFEKSNDDSNGRGQAECEYYGILAAKHSMAVCPLVTLSVSQCGDDVTLSALSADTHTLYKTSPCPLVASCNSTRGVEKFWSRRGPEAGSCVLEGGVRGQRRCATL